MRPVSRQWVADSLARASGLHGMGARAVSPKPPDPPFRDHTTLWRNAARAARSRLWRASVTDPMRPLNRAAGNKARYAVRISDVALSPVALKSPSDADTISSRPGTALPSCVVIPHTRKSSKGGTRQSNRAGLLGSVRLRHDRQQHITGLHGTRSASEYTGSSSP